MFDNKYIANKTNKLEFSELSKLNLGEIIQVNFPENQYIREITNKNQLVLHHTVSGLGVDGDINYWRSTVERVATSVIIDRNGKIFQCFSSKYWGYHLGLKTGNNLELNKKSIGIELDSWGGLIEHNNKWYPAEWSLKYKKNVANLRQNPIKDVVVYDAGYRGFYGFEKYTDEQIISVYKLLKYWGDVYNISLKYNEDMWDVSDNAISGKSGVWSHVSYRQDKSDIHPQNNIIQMLKQL